MPKVAALPIVFAWFGLGDLSKIVIITISVFYPVYIAAFFGAKSTSRVHVWAARNMGAGRWRIFCRIVLPSALPQLFNGLRVGLALSFIVMFVSELIAARRGLGYLITFAEEQMRFDIMYVVDRHHRHPRVRRRPAAAGAAPTRAQGPAPGHGGGAMSAASHTLRTVGRGLAANYSIFLLLVAYELLSRSGLVSPRLIPSLLVIGEQLWRYTLNGDLPYHAGISLYRAFAGFLLATVVGIAFGVAMARSRWFEALFEPIFSFGYPIPKSRSIRSSSSSSASAPARKWRWCSSNASTPSRSTPRPACARPTAS